MIPTMDHPSPANLARVSASSGFCLLIASCTAPVLQDAKLAAPAPQKQEFRPPQPDESASDWVRLTSGEWLKGEVKVLRQDQLEFDSDKLDLLKIDWEDVAELRSSKQQMVGVEGRREPYVGTILVRDGKVVVKADTELSFERALLLSIVPGLPSEWNYWSGKWSLGMGTRSGNTRQTDFSSYLFLRRQTTSTRFDTTYNGALSKVGGTETVNNNRLDSRFDVFLTRRLYVTPLSIGLYQDRFQNIALRVTPAAGVGYEILDDGKMTWNVLASVGYQYTRFESVVPGQEDTDKTAALIFQTDYEWDLTSSLELKLDYEISVPVPSTHEYNHHLAAIFSADLLSDDLDLDVQLIWDRINDPSADSAGVIPDQDDFRISIGIGYSF